MLTIIINDRHEINWYVGQKFPELWQPENPHAPRRYVEAVFADGHELEYIRQHFANIPIANGRIVKWNGEMAQFIFDNLK